MIIPLVNPSRSRRKVSRKRSSAKAHMAWVRSFVHKAKKRPAKRRRTLRAIARKPHSRSSIMRVISLRPRKTSRRRRARRNPRFGHHRPVLTYGPKGWRRARHPKLMRKRTWVNPRKRRVSRRRRWNPVAAVTNPRRYVSRYRRRNPVKFPLAQVGKEAVMITGGFVLGMYAITGFAHVQSLQKYRNYYGIMHIVLGTLGVGCSKKNPYLRSLSIAFASAGLYDLVACNVKQLGLPTMHTGGEHPAVAAAEGAVSTTTLANAAAATPPASQDSGMGTSYGSNFRGDFIDALIDD